MEERRHNMSLTEMDREWIEGLIVKSHDGRIASFSGMFQSMQKIIEAQGKQINEQGKQIAELQKALIPFTEAANAGKLSYVFILKFIGLISAVGGMMLLYKQLWKIN